MRKGCKLEAGESGVMRLVSRSQGERLVDTAKCWNAKEMERTKNDSSRRLPGDGAVSSKERIEATRRGRVASVNGW